MNTKQKIIVGISGGVDSAVTAYLLKKQGYEVEGVFMQNWETENDDPFCTGERDLTDAKAVCAHLDIPFHTVNFAHEYWHNVFQHCLNEYAEGRTPNPDIGCNKEIKFKVFLEYALNHGADFLATGHYVRKAHHGNHYRLLRGIDDNKDQSYFLYTLTQRALEKSLFPLGELTKPDVRKIAAEINLPNQSKKDSTGICFVGERKFKTFLQEFLLAQPGQIKNERGDVLGEHEGLMYYTLGQRKGLHLGGQKSGVEAPWYVIDKRTDDNALVVAQDHDHPKLLAHALLCTDLHWMGHNLPTSPLTCTAKIRYRHTDHACRLIPDADGTYRVEFEEAQRAITPGQAIVFYDGTVCLGGATILEPLQGKRQHDEADQQTLRAV